MPRKQTGKARLLEDDISDSGGSDEDNAGFQLSGDEAAEFALNANPYGHKNKRRKVDMFAGESDQEDQRPPRGKAARSNLTKTPKFVPSATSTKDEEGIDNLAASIEGQIPVDEPIESSSEESGSDMDEDEAEEALPIQPDPPQELPRGGIGRGGIGSQSQNQGGIGSQTRGGIGSQPSRGGIGSAQAAPSFAPPDLPSAFGTRPTRSFLSQPTAKPKATPAALSSEEARHFNKLESAGGVGYKLLAKMGWSSGTGLGAEGQGRVTPVDSQLRPKNAGIGSGGFSERTKQSKAEARRRGEDIPDEEEEIKGRRGKKGKAGFGNDRASRDAAPQREEVWKKSKPRKSKIEHKTYEEILAESAETKGVESGLGELIDLSGAAVSAFLLTAELC